MKKLIFAAMLTSVTTPAIAHETQNCTIGQTQIETEKYDGQKMTVHITGTGPDVIMIPGLSTPREIWADSAAKFSGCYRLHLVQIRGFGDDAGGNAEGEILNPFVTELANYIQEQKLDHPAIVGHSLGGLSALMLGARHADLPGKIMVVDALPFIGTLFNPAATVEIMKPQAAAMTAGIRAQYGAERPVVDGDPGEQSVAGGLSGTIAGRTQVAKWNAAADPRVTAQALYDDLTTDMRAELPNITAPVTLLYAQDDRLFPAAAATATFVPQYEGTPNFNAEMISESRHFIMLDQSEKFAEKLGIFLSK